MASFSIRQSVLFRARENLKEMSSRLSLFPSSKRFVLLLFAADDFRFSRKEMYKDLCRLEGFQLFTWWFFCLFLLRRMWHNAVLCSLVLLQKYPFLLLLIVWLNARQKWVICDFPGRSLVEMFRYFFFCNLQRTRVLLLLLLLPSSFISKIKWFLSSLNR